jgi:hypothetical protein
MMAQRAVRSVAKSRSLLSSGAISIHAFLYRKLNAISTAAGAAQQDRTILRTATPKNGNSSIITWRLLEQFGNSGSIPARAEIHYIAKAR